VSGPSFSGTSFFCGATSVLLAMRLHSRAVPATDRDPAA
jgi:hypothetical protein